MPIPYTPDVNNALQDGYAPVPFSDDIAYATPNPIRVDSKFFLVPVQDEIQALINGRVSSKEYHRLWNCPSDLNIGDPVRIINDSTTAGFVDLADATTSARAAVIGFVRFKPTATECLLDHFFQVGGVTDGVGTGGGGTDPFSGAPVYLSDAGGYSATPGTFPKTVGVFVSDDAAWLCATPLSAVSALAVLGDNSVTTSAIADGAVTTPKIANNAVTGAKLDTGIVDNASIELNGSTKLAIKPNGVTGSMLDTGIVDNSTIEINGSTKLAVKPGGITTNELDDTTVLSLLPFGAPIISIGAESSHTRVIIFNIEDLSGAANFGRMCLIEAWLSDTVGGWETSTTPTNFSVASGTAADTPTANKRIRYLTSSISAVSAVQITAPTGSFSWYLNFSVGGVVYTTSQITFI